METLWYNCAKVREEIEILLGMISWVASGIGVLNRDPDPTREREIFGGGGVLCFLIHWF